MSFLGVVLAAGKGKRLRPLTLLRSKPMLPVLGKPLIEWVLEMLYSGGVEHFVVVVNPADELLNEHLRRRSAFRHYVSLAFQERPLGMADALKHAVPLIHDDFFLTACDSLVRPEHIQEMLRIGARPEVRAVLSLQPVPREEFSRLGSVELDGPWVRRIVEKPGPQRALSDYASLPVYLLPQSILGYLEDVPLSPRGEYEIQDAIQALIENEGGVYGLVTDWRMDVTTVEDLLELNIHFLQQGYAERVPEPSQMGPGTRVLPPVRVEENVRIGRDCLIGPCAYIESGAFVGDGATVRWAVVLGGCVIEDGEDVTGELRYPQPQTQRGGDVQWQAKSPSAS